MGIIDGSQDAMTQDSRLFPKRRLAPRLWPMCRDLRDRFGCWGFLDLWRSAPAEPFSPAEVGFLTNVAAPVTTALRGSQAGHFVVPATREHRPGPVVLLLNGDLEVRAQTPETQDHLRMLVPPAGDEPPIPASAYNVAGQLLANEAELIGHLVTGSDTRELAQQMFLSEHTVQDHLKSIFTKISTHSRPTLVSKALGT